MNKDLYILYICLTAVLEGHTACREGRACIKKKGNVPLWTMVLFGHAQICGLWLPQS